MKLKNITISDKELTDAFTGERITVKAGKSIELDRAIYNKNSFKQVNAKVTEDKIEETKENNIEKIEQIKIEKEVI